MREIKFRGRRLDNGKWVTGDLLHSKSGKVLINAGTKMFTTYAEVDPNTVGQPENQTTNSSQLTLFLYTMTPLIISLTAAALSLAAAAVATVRVRWLAARLKSQKEFADALNRLCASSDPTEHRFIAMPFRDSILVLKCRGGMLCLVKKFTDPDEDFNRLCAEELVEKLNEK